VVATFWTWNISVIADRAVAGGTGLLAIFTWKSVKEGRAELFGGSPGFPFLDIANQVIVYSASFDTALLAGLDQDQIVAKLSNPSDPVTQAIVGTANYLTRSDLLRYP
jgi:hypothetical protein